jgi:hypothetical protein
MVHNSQFDLCVIFQHTNMKKKWNDNSIAYSLQGVSETALKQRL